MASGAGVIHVKDFHPQALAWEGRLVVDPCDPSQYLILVHKCRLAKSRKGHYAIFERKGRLGWTQLYHLLANGGLKGYLTQGHGGLYTTEAQAVRGIARLYQQLPIANRRTVANSLTIGAGLDSGQYWSLDFKPIRVVRTQQQIQHYYQSLFEPTKVTTHG